MDHAAVSGLAHVDDLTAAQREDAKRPQGAASLAG